jgi:hypothetical protein
LAVWILMDGRMDLAVVESCKLHATREASLLLHNACFAAMAR